MSEKKPESEPKKKSILDELRNFQIASLAIQHQAGIHGPYLNFPGLVPVLACLLPVFPVSSLGLSKSVKLKVRESLILGKIRRFHQRKSSVWRSIDSMSFGKAK